MPATTSPAAIENCPDCALPTTARFFREFRERRLCLLCFRREEDAAATLLARNASHGGFGWLWKNFVGVFPRTFHRSIRTFRS